MKNISMTIATLVTVALTLTVLFVTSCEPAVPGDEPLTDNGWVVDPSEGVELHPSLDSLSPGRLPREVSWPADDARATVIANGVELANDWLGASVFVAETGLDHVSIEVASESGEPDAGMAWHTALAAGATHEAAVTWTHVEGCTWGECEGTLLYARIGVTTDDRFDDEVLTFATARALLQSIGLADDEGAGSVMCSPLDEGGVLTQQDFALLRPYIEAAGL